MTWKKTHPSKPITTRINATLDQSPKLKIGSHNLNFFPHEHKRIERPKNPCGLCRTCASWFGVCPHSLMQDRIHSFPLCGNYCGTHEVEDHIVVLVLMCSL